MKKNKIILIVVAAILLTGIILIVKNIGDTTVYLDSKTALAGDTVQIPLSIKKNHGIWGGQIIINYNSEAISFVSCSNGEVFDECEVNNNDGELVILVTQSDLDDTKENGLIATLNFKAKVSADKGEYDISFNTETNFCDSDEKMVEPIFKKGVITVK